LTDPNLVPTRTPPSLWAASARPAPATSPLGAAEARADVVVIGAGFTGLCAALRLAQNGVDVVLLEAAELGWGGSGRNNGQVIPCLSRADPELLVQAFGAEKGEAIVGLIRDSASIVFDLIRKHGIECEAVQNGWVQPAHRPGRMALAKSRYEQWRRRGAPVELLDREQVGAITGSSYWHGGWQNPTGGHINPLGLVRGLADAALQAGARIFTHTPALALAPAASGWRVATPQGAVMANKVIIATQAYSGFFAPGLWPGLARTVVPVRSYQMATAPLPAALRRRILPQNHAMSDTHGDLYFCRFDSAGRLVTGGALVLHHDYAQRLPRRIGARMEMLFPALREAGALKFEHIWHGNIAVTSDALPHVHKLADGVYAWLGDNGRGVALAAALGGVIADAARGVPESTLPLPFMPVTPIPMHAMAVKVAPLALLGYRWRDGRG
jgi:glycine/D-amino acid oxidase-like deaminating enzyme